MEEAKEEKLESRPKRRKVSLFKRRRKAEIRPFVKEKKEKKLKKLFKLLGIVIAIIFAVSAILYGIRYLLIVTVFSNKTIILNPQSTSSIGNEDVEKTLRANNIAFQELAISSVSGMIKFRTNDVQVFISSQKKIDEQILTLQAILRRLSLDGKRPTLVDLRYNKPIVKF